MITTIAPTIKYGIKSLYISSMPIFAIAQEIKSVAPTI